MELIEQVLALPLEERRALFHRLADSLLEEGTWEKGVRRYETLMEIAKNALDVTDYQENREVANVLVRSFVCWELHREGYSRSQRGELMGKDRSSVIAMDNRMRFIFSCPAANKKEIHYWDIFIKSIEEYETEQRTAQGAAAL